MMEYLFSICILTLNHVQITQKCLMSLITTNFPGNVELIIVDNGSDDGTAEWLMQFQKEYASQEVSISLVFNHENKGCTGGRNQALLLARGEYIVILDNDVEVVDRDWLVNLYQYFIENDGIGIIGPKLVYADNPTMIQSAGFGVTKKGRLGFWGQGKASNDPAFNEVREVQGYPAACWLFRKSLVDEVGLFDDDFFPVQYEDVDFCYRVRQRGYKIIYYPEVVLHHHEHITTKQTKGLHFYRVTVRNGLLFQKKWRHFYEKEDGMCAEDITWVK